jgi:O-antigen/teichoic acid export membrane protein
MRTLRSPRPRPGATVPGSGWIRLWLADSSVLLGSQLLTVVATSGAAILIARQLDPSDWGVFSGLLALSLALSVVIQFGTGTWLLRELSRLFVEPDAPRAAEARALVNSALVLNGLLAVSVLAGGTGVAVLLRLDPAVTFALGALLAYSGLIASSYLMEAHLRARRRVGRVALATLLEKFLLVGLVGAVAAVGGSVRAIGTAYLLAGLVRVVFVRLSVFGVGGDSSRPSRLQVARVFRGTLPFALTSSCLSVIPKLDTFLLLMLSATSAGYFALGDRLLGPAVVFPEVLSITLFPFFARRPEWLAPPWILSSSLAAVGALAALVLILTAPTLVPALFGAKYSAAVPAVRVFALALPLAFAIGPLRVYDYSRNEERRVVGVALMASVVGSVGIVTGQLALGVVAAAGAYVLRYAVLLAGLSVVAVRATGRSADRVTPAPTIVEVVSP